MKSQFLVAALAAISAASPVMLVSRTNTTCEPLPAGSGPTVKPDTPAEFQKFTYFSTTAKTEVTPRGYNQTFTNLHASTMGKDYLGYHTLSSYNASACADTCSDKAGCIAFNIYFERDPTVDPNNRNCSNPPSTTMIKCGLWGNRVTAANAKNHGQYRGEFHVVIAGSNGYISNTVSTN